MDGEPAAKKLRADEEAADLAEAAEDLAAGEEGEEGEEEAAFDEETERLLQQAEDAQRELNKVNDAASEEVLQVEVKYNAKRQPFYQQRGDVLSQVPGFWKFALYGHAQLRAFLTDDDLAALDAATRLDVVDAPDIKSGFTITFRFTPEDNPFFTNEVLEKALHFSEDNGMESRATVITWKEGMGPAEADESGKRQRGNEFNFFTSWFLTEKYPPGTQDQVAELIKDDIYSDPIKYFHDGLTALRNGAEDAEGQYLVDEGEDYDEMEEPDDGEGEGLLAGEEAPDYDGAGYELGADEGEEPAS